MPRALCKLPSCLDLTWNLNCAGPCTEPNCNKFACPLPAGAMNCQWGFAQGVHCGNLTVGGYGGLGAH